MSQASRQAGLSRLQEEQFPVIKKPTSDRMNFVEIMKQKRKPEKRLPPFFQGAQALL
jgi:hypothetical protein